MPKVNIDYSNTIFYKIFCKDPTIKDLYVGMTTNFVQRKHAHKQSCTNEKTPNYHCKLYNALRNAGGWENWQMEIIAFHKCKDSYEAHKKEQEYFEILGATLNSIQPLPKPKEPSVKIVKEENSSKNAEIFTCEKCDFTCSKKSNYDKHLMTRKHKSETNETDLRQKNAFTCKTCLDKLNSRASYYRHKQKCGIFSHEKNSEKNPDEQTSHTPQPVQQNNALDKDNIIIELLQQNKEMMHMLFKAIQGH
jgi:hypothetical protein